MDIINTARMDTGGKGRRGLKRGEEFPPHFAHYDFSFVTGQNHNKVTRRRFNFTFYSKLTYILM